MYCSQYNYHQAIKDLNKATALDPQNGGYYYGRGIVYQTMGRMELANRDFAKAKQLGFKK